MAEYPHIFLNDIKASISFTSPRRGGSKPVFQRERQSHGQKLLDDLEKANAEVKSRKDQRWVESKATKTGTYLAFLGSPNIELISKSLEKMSGGSANHIRLLNVTERPDHSTSATVFIPSSQKGVFVRKLKQYMNEETSKGYPRHQPLIESIEQIQIAVLESFWTDDPQLMPERVREYCEVWLRGDDPQTLSDFEVLLETLNIPMTKGSLTFPERLVVLIQANRADLVELIEACDTLAELRRAKETAAFFMEQSAIDLPFFWFAFRHERPGARQGTIPKTDQQSCSRG